MKTEEDEEDEAMGADEKEVGLDGSAAAAEATTARPKLGWLSAMLEAAIQQRAHQLLDAPLLFVSEATLVAFHTRSAGSADGTVPLERTESATKPSALMRQRTLRRQLSLTPVDDALLAQLIAAQPELPIEVARAAVRQCDTAEMASAWVLENADQVAQIIADGGAGSDSSAEGAAGAVDPALAKSAADDTADSTSSSRVACGRILMWLGPQGDLEQNKGHTGSFYELRTLANRRMLEVYLIYECGRRMQRRLVFSSDTRFSLAGSFIHCVFISVGTLCGTTAVSLYITHYCPLLHMLLISRTLPRRSPNRHRVTRPYESARNEAQRR